MIAANEQEVIDVQSIIELTTLKAICETSVGIDNATDENAVDSIENMVKFGYRIRYLANTPWLWPRYTYIFSSSGKDFYHSLNSIHNFTVNAINKYILIRAQMGKHDNDNTRQNIGNIKNKRSVYFIDTLISSYQKGDIYIECIREEVDTTIFGGHDTTSSTISFCLYTSGLHKDYQKLLQYETETAERKNISDEIQNM